MMVKRGYKAELDLNNEQITLAKKHCGAARWAFNYGLRPGTPGSDGRSRNRTRFMACP